MPTNALPFLPRSKCEHSCPSQGKIVFYTFNFNHGKGKILVSYIVSDTPISS